MTEAASLFDLPHQRIPYDGRKAVARRGDPRTSVEAARSLDAQALNRGQQFVLNAFKLTRRPLTDDELIAEVARHFPTARLSDSSVRTRRRECERRGLVRFAGSFGKTASGRRARRFEITERA